MDKLFSIRQPITEELALLNKTLTESLHTTSPLMNEVIQAYLESKGKQIRPILVLLCAKLFGEVPREAIDAAASLEMLHNASLIHDDVVDESQKRRGLPTINHLYDNRIAVLVGDYFVSCALACSIKTNKMPIVSCLGVLGRDLARGEIDQLSNARNHLLDENAYFEVIRRKTASLFYACMQVGALSAGGTGVKQSVRTPVEMGERIELKTPDPKMGLTINEALAARSSSRDFSPEMLSLEELSGVLWAAAGVNREDGHLTAPSAMALYPIRVYAFLPEGVYRYDSKANVLNRVIEGDRRELTAMQDFAYTAPLNLVYVADYSVYADRNQPVDRIRFWCAADAGGYTENVNLYAAGNGLKAITRGSFKEEALLELLGLDPAQYGVILAQTVGR